MPTLRERMTRLLLGNQLQQLEQLNQRLFDAYLEGPYLLQPDQLARQLREQWDGHLVQDLVNQLQYEHLGSYTQDLEGERSRAVRDATRMWRHGVLARWIVGLWTSYGMGESIEITCKDDDAQEVWQEFWTADRNAALLNEANLHEISRWLLNTGNRFLVFFISTLDGEARVRSILPDEIKQVVSHPEDSSTPHYYKREWTHNGTSQTLYYPDWAVFFSEGTLPPPPDNGQVAEQDGTVAVILHTPLERRDERSPFGWPLLAPAGTPWLRSQREFVENRLSVSRAVASVVRRYTTGGGSRAVDAVVRSLASSLQYGATSETNPPPVAGSSEVLNRAIEAQDLPLRTGAQDAKSDNETFAWMAGLTGGVFPHYLGLGDAYRLATATAMEKPLYMQFSLYRKKLSSLFRSMATIVLKAQERYANASYETLEVSVTTDRLVEADLSALASGLGQAWRDILKPAIDTGQLPREAAVNLLVFSIQTLLQAAGATDVSEIINADMFGDTTEEADLMEQIEAVVAEAVNIQTGKVEPQGEPLDPWPEGEPVPISADDVAQAIRNWNRRVPPEAVGLLSATTAPEEEPSA